MNNYLLYKRDIKEIEEEYEEKYWDWKDINENDKSKEEIEDYWEKWYIILN